MGTALLRALRRGVALALLPVALLAAETPEDATLVLKYERAELRRVVRDIARKIGATYLYDAEALGGTITLTGYDRVTPDEARELLHAALLLRGNAVLPTPSGALRIVPVAEGAALAPWRPAGGSGGDEAPVSTLVRLRAARADEILSTLQPWLGTGVVAMAYPPTNSVILAGSELRLRTLLTVLRSLDEAADVALVRRVLRHRGVGEIEPLLRDVFSAPDDGSAYLQKLELWSDPRTNALIFRGSPALVRDVRDFLARVDRAPRGGGRLAVIPVRHVAAEDLADRLAELESGRRSRPAPPTPPDPDDSPDPPPPAPATDPDGEPEPDRAGADASSEVLVGEAFTVAVDAPTNSLVASGDPESLRLLEEVARALDRPPPVVTLDLIIFEVSSSERLRLAADFTVRSAGSTTADTLAEITSLPSGEIASPEGVLGGSGTAEFLTRYTRIAGLVPFIDSQGNATFIEIASRDGAVTALAREVHTRVLMRPHLSMVSGAEHELFVGDNVPILRGNADSEGGPLEVRQNVERQDVGLRLRLRPTVGERGTVRFELDLERTAVVPSNLGPVEDVGPRIQQRRLDTTLLLRDGELAVAGALLEPRVETSVVGVPLLSAIPLLGALFRSTSTSEVWTQLLVAVVPRVQRGEDSLVAEAIRRRLGFERALARTAGLSAPPEAPFAVLVTTRGLATDAEDIARGLATEAYPAQVVPWQSGGEQRFDVYVTGFASLAEAGEVSRRLRGRGWSPEVVSVPEL